MRSLIEQIELKYALPVLLGLITCLGGQSLVAEDAPVKVYILSGQSNMVGQGSVSGGDQRWGDEFINPTLSVYPGNYDPSVDYDQMEPAQTLQLEQFGGVKPTPYPGEGVHIVRGQLEMPESGVYEFYPGYAKSMDNIMFVDGHEVYRREPGGDAEHNPIALNAGETVPFKIIYLNEHANGLGWHARVDIPGTLQTVVRKDGKFQYLVDEKGNFVPRDDVWYKGVVAARADKWLNYGCGASQRKIGPELGFGHMVGNYHEAPVLLLKASQGNRSLGWDFLPPGSERFEHTDSTGAIWIYAGYKDSAPRWLKGGEPKAVNWYAGKQYDECVNEAKEVLDNFDKHFPHWEGRGYEIAGFVWWQGYKDGGHQGTDSASVYADRYEHNLVNLIHTLRQDFDAPEAPLVVATCGFGGGADWQPGSSADTIFRAQMSVSDPAQYPEFNGTVRSVDTRPYFRPREESPRNQGFHYHANAETYMDIGEAMGRAMIELQP